MNPSTTSHYSLNSNQLLYLKLIYKFRFITSSLISQHKRKTETTSTYLALKNLYDQGYIGRRYDKTYKLRGKPASYYLLPKGLKALKASSVGTAKVHKNIYKDKTASTSFIVHCLSLFEIHNRLRSLYPERLSYFSKTELAPEAYNYFPDRRPDAYLRLETGPARPKEFFLEYFDVSRPLVSQLGRLRQYANYLESQQWGAQEVPILLILCQTAAIEQFIRKSLIRLNSPLDVYTALKSSLETHPTGTVWSFTGDPDIKLALPELS